MKHITVNLDDGYGAIVDSLDEFEQRLTDKTSRLVARLAQMGAQSAGIGFSGASYDGDGSVSVTWESRGENAAAVVAAGNAVLFIEFGAGYLMGYGHPDPMGFGPGTYPGKGHWNDPQGWIYAHDKPRSFGNPPTAAMYNARKELEQNLIDLAREFLE